MSLKKLAFALAISAGAASMALAQTVTNPPSGSLGMNNTENTSGTLNAPRPGSTSTMSTGENHSSTADMSTQGTDDTNRGTTGTHMTKTTAKRHVTKRSHTVGVVKSMSNGTSGNAATPNTQLHGNNGG